MGRLAFPIFAFMIAEGYFHTKDYKKYMIRLLICALISEIPFDLMYEGGVFFPFHQNVIWTFIIALLCIRVIDTVRERGNKVKFIFTSLGFSLLGFLAGTLGMTDYFGPGVLTVLVFYFFRGRKWYMLLAQVISLYLINVSMLSGQDIPLIIGGHEFFFTIQGFALLALIPIWLYRGKQGIRNSWTKWSFYLFYPVHMLILALIGLS